MGQCKRLILLVSWLEFEIRFYKEYVWLPVIVIDFGCVSHIVNLCANSLVKALHYPVEELLMLLLSRKFKKERGIQL